MERDIQGITQRGHDASVDEDLRHEVLRVAGQIGLDTSAHPDFGRRDQLGRINLGGDHAFFVRRVRPVSPRVVIYLASTLGWMHVSV
jgi:hypothetical protein